jgi:hypothetical protein
MADIFTIIAIITGVSIRVEIVATYAATTETAFTEVRPATLAEADRVLAAYGFGRVGNWDLGSNGDVIARVRMIDNLFNGTRAARIWQALGNTHTELERSQAGSVENGDIISDLEMSEVYVVAGCSLEGDTMKIHMVREGKTWTDRYTTEFHPNQAVMVARRKA